MPKASCWPKPINKVTEAHTAWKNQADKEGMSVHVHSEGGGATHFMLGCIEDAEKITGDLDQRNVLAHLHFVTDQAYPIKSFYDAGANVVFHSDYPVSPMMNVKYSIYMAEKRTTPKEMLGGIRLRLPARRHREGSPG